MLCPPSFSPPYPRPFLYPVALVTCAAAQARFQDFTLGLPSKRAWIRRRLVESRTIDCQYLKGWINFPAVPPLLLGRDSLSFIFPDLLAELSERASFFDRPLTCLMESYSSYGGITFREKARAGRPGPD